MALLVLISRWNQFRISTFVSICLTLGVQPMQTYFSVVLQETNSVQPNVDEGVCRLIHKVDQRE